MLLCSFALTSIHVSLYHHTHRKGSLHMHGVGWGGLPPDLLSRIASFQDLCKEVEKVLESMYCATLPREVHVADLVNKELPRYSNSCDTFGEKRVKAGRAMLVTPDPALCEGDFNDFCHACICRCGIHTHCMTCRKPPMGYVGCRLCRPAGLVDMTGPVELADVTQPGKRVCNGKIQLEYQVVPGHKIKPAGGGEAQDGASNGNGNGNNDQRQEVDIDELSEPDNRMVVWEIKRPKLEPLPSPSEMFNDGEVNVMDDEAIRRWYLDCLGEEMMGYDPSSAESANAEEEESDKDPSEQKWPPPGLVGRGNINLYNPDPDGNCLFSSISNFIDRIKMPDTGGNAMSCDRLRSVAMDYLLEHRKEEISGLSLEDIVLTQLDEIVEFEKGRREKASPDDKLVLGPVPKLETLEDYAEAMKDATSKKCLWGNNLEIHILSKLYSFNVAVYTDNTMNRPGMCYLLNPIFNNKCWPTLYLLHTGNNHFNWFRRIPAEQPLLQRIQKSAVSEKRKEFVRQLVSELKCMKLEDLKKLYADVSSALPERNGYVVEYNKLLTALLGSNTNSSFLGSREQSQGALFYIGPYICKK